MSAVQRRKGAAAPVDRTKQPKQEISERESEPGAVTQATSDPSNADEKTNARRRVQRMRKPEKHAALVMFKYGMSNLSDRELGQLAVDLEESNARIAKGDMGEPEAMLFSQAQALNSIFFELAWKARDSMKIHMETAEKMLRLALKAQSQSRCALEALAEMKNPRPVAFVQQANIAHGPQQVNNGAAKNTTSDRTESPRNTQSKQLEHRHGKRLDFGAAETASQADSSLEAVGAIHGAQD